MIPTGVSTIVRSAIAAVLATVFGLSQSAAAAPPADRTDTGSYTAGGLTYDYRSFVPGALPEAPALLVMVHGCNTTAEQQQQASQLDPIARRAGFVVLYVDGSPLNELQGRCWSGLAAPGNESRTSGDAAAIAGMTRLVADRHHVDSQRIYALGMSSGAFQTAMLGGHFPDLYAAIGLHSGGPFGHGVPGCVGTYLPIAAPEALAARAFSAQGEHRRVLPVIAFHGDADKTVPYECGQEAVEQWRLTNNTTLAAQGVPEPIPATPSNIGEGVAQVAQGHRFTVRTWELPNSPCPVLQSWTVHGEGHFWSGGSPDARSAQFTDPRGPNASELVWQFFSRIDRTENGYHCRRSA